jgi:hypothetical protein
LPVDKVVAVCDWGDQVQWSIPGSNDCHRPGNYGFVVLEFGEVASVAERLKRVYDVRPSFGACRFQVDE